MAAAVVGAAALVLIVWEMLRHGQGTGPPLWARIARPFPFVIVSLLSVYAAARAPRGRKSFQIDLSLWPEDLLQSMTKGPHLRSIAVILLLAVLAFGTQRLLLAFVATMLVGASWELAQTTVVGHNARLADLAPNLVAGAATVLVLLALRAVCSSRAARRR